MNPNSPAPNIGSGRRAARELLNQKPKLLSQMREALRTRHYSKRTEASGCDSGAGDFAYPANSFATHLLEGGYDIRNSGTARPQACGNHDDLY
jgi:hypothetical protein